MKEMVYYSNRTNPEVLAEGTHNNFSYYVMTLGTHPCAYVDVTDTILANKDYHDIDIECHGGLTYSREDLYGIDKKGWFIGWDYTHFGDYAGYFSSLDLFDGKKWTTTEMVNECINVIDQICNLINKQEKEANNDTN